MPAMTRASTGASKGKTPKKAKHTHTTVSEGTTLQPGQQASWGFFKLPREVRDMIYNYSCMKKSRQVVVSSSAPMLGCPSWIDKEPAISMTCRSARQEALSVYYSRNRFAVMVPKFNLKPFDNWITKVDDCFLKSITSIWFIFCGGGGAADPSKWIKSQKDRFDHKADIQYRGEERESNRFEKAMEIATDLRRQHMQWKNIKDILMMCNEMADVASEGIEDIREYDFDSSSYQDEVFELHGEFCVHSCRHCGHCHSDDIDTPCKEEDCKREDGHGEYDCCCECGCCHRKECPNRA